MHIEITKKMLEEAINDGKTLKQIGLETGWHPETLSRYCKKYGIFVPKRSQIKNLKGMRFGRLIVKEQIKDHGKNTTEAIWLCECECGNIKGYLSRSLTRKSTTSCGCYDAERKWKGIGNLSSTYFTSIKIRAQEKRWEFDLTKEFLWNLYLQQDKKCALSGLDITIAKDNGRRSIRNSSLDRIDSNIGYIKNNVQWVHKDINTLKMNLEQNTFIHYCKLVDEYQYINKQFKEYVEKNIPRHWHWKGFKEINGAYWADIIAGAKKRKILFDITIEQIWNLFIKQKGRCALSGLELQFHKDNTEKHARTASLDRINSKESYHIKNCQWIHKDLNLMKMDKDQKYFIFLCKTITEYQTSKKHLTNSAASSTIEM